MRYILVAAGMLAAAPASANDVGKNAALHSDLWLLGSLEFVSLDRSRERVPLTISAGSQGITSNNLPLNGSDIAADARLALGIGQFGLGGRYLGHFSWDDSITESDSNTIFTTPNINVGGGVVPTTFNHGSDFSSWEANAIWLVNPGVRLFAGVRAINIDETFEAAIGPTTANFAFETENDLLGGHIGIQARLLDEGPGPGFFLDGGVSVGYYDNDRSLAGTNTGIGGALPTFGGSDDRRAIAAEAEIKLGYQFSEKLGAHVGYRILHIEHVATAIENFNSFNIATNAGSLTGRDILYQGISVGLTLKL